MSPTIVESEAKSSSLPWLFSARIDLLTFLGSAALALGLLAIGAPLGLLESDTPEWTWVFAILLIDVAHVYATGFRVYFDRMERSRRPWLYGLTPLLAWAVGWAVYTESVSLFWRLLAYLAVFHFIRQQYGWVALYRSRADERGRLGWWIDAGAIYLATVYPLVYWHTHLPRRFWWFRDGDFASLPVDLVDVLGPLYWTALAAYAVRSLYRTWYLKRPNPGKDIVVATTALCWYIGIITFDSDYAFTVTNVIIHGVPYMVLVYWYRWQRDGQRQASSVPTIVRFLAVVWILAYAEELLWDGGVWHERSWLFGTQWDPGALEGVLVALLAVPQITHYVLDGFIWRRRSSSRLRSWLRGSAGGS
ncbi:hypothetical protein [Roseimaritima sediminicola]|uniref:hypothetical protein n=1 Tax=Roseimaritima sediminicola TaxID=2662066 RepID=UPI0012982709|nr:hypothetical protein [Roseimaritima sediminicola]